MIPRTLLIASGAFQTLSAERVASAIARGLQSGGFPADECPLDIAGDPRADVCTLLDALHFDERMRRARAVVLAEHLLRERALLGSATLEIASRARQAGVPAYAVTAINLLDPFDARILDLQAVIQAGGVRGLARAGRELAGLV